MEVTTEESYCQCRDCGQFHDSTARDCGRDYESDIEEKLRKIRAKSHRELGEAWSKLAHM